MSVYVSIGRNVAEHPMDIADWNDFIARAEDAVQGFAGPLVTSATGTGHYEGQREDTAVLVGAGSPTPSQLSALKLALRSLARAFNQECISLAVADPAFLS